MPLGEEAALSLRSVTLTSEYLNRLLAQVRRGLDEEQGGVDHVWLEHGPEGLCICMEARGLHMSYEVDEPAYHYHPDGLDVDEHATWLVQLFDEEAR